MSLYELMGFRPHAIKWRPFNMILQLYAVQDVKVGAFLPPMSFRSRGEAVRSFTSACQDEKHQFFAHRADYELYQLGAFDDADGKIVGLPKPERVIGGGEL